MEIINEEQEKRQQQATPPQTSNRKNHFRNRRTGQGRAASGIVLILAGLMLLLANFDVIQGNVSYYLFNWKTILIALGIIFIGAKDNKIPGYIMLGLGIIFWLPELIGDYYLSLSDVFWPSILILIGLVLITRHQGYFHKNKGAFNRETGEPDGYLNDVSIFGGGVKLVKSDNFKGGNLTAIFGGSEFDLRQVDIVPEGAVIDVVTIFGGTKFVIPEDWNVITDVVAILGGVSDKRAKKISSEKSDKTLVIKGIVIFGGVEIKSF